LPSTVVFPGNARNGNNRVSRRASGRRYCTSAVGTNLTPKRLPPLSARVMRRLRLSDVNTCLLSGRLTKVWNFTSLTAT
jgi:hypothetical protein